MSNLDETCPKWIQLVKNGSNLYKMDQTCQKWIRLVQNRLNLYDQTCPNLIKFVQIGPRKSKNKWPKLVQNG